MGNQSCCSKEQELMVDQHERDESYFLIESANQSRRLQQYENAIDSLLQAISVSIKANDGNTKTAAISDIYVQMAEIFQLQNKRDQAINHYQLALQIRSSIYGETSLQVSQIQEIVSMIYFNNYMYQEAFQYIGDLLGTIKVIYGEKDSKVADFLSLRGECAQEQGLIEEAFSQYEQAYNIQEKNKNYSSAANQLERMGEICEMNKENQKAKNCYEKMLKILTKNQLELKYHEAYMKLGVIEAKLKNFDLSIYHFLKSFELVSNGQWSNKSSQSQLMKKILIILDALYLLTHDKKQSLQARINWMELELSEKEPGLDYEYTYYTQHLSMCYYGIGDYSKALSYFTITSNRIKAKREEKCLTPEDNLEIGIAYTQFGLILIDTERYEESEENLNKALEIFSLYYQNYDLLKIDQILDITKHKAILKFQQQHYEEAIDLLEGVVLRYIEKYGTKHIKTIQSQLALGRILKGMGLFNQAKEVLEEALENRIDANLEYVQELPDGKTQTYENSYGLFDVSEMMQLMNQSPDIFDKEIERLSLQCEIAGEIILEPQEEEIRIELIEIEKQRELMSSSLSILYETADEEEQQEQTDRKDLVGEGEKENLEE